MFWFIFGIITLILTIVLALFLVLETKRLQKSYFLITCIVILLFVSRLMIIIGDLTNLTLPFNLNLIIGIPILSFSILLGVFAEITIKFHSFSRTVEGKPLFTSGIYGIIRHPIYLCEILWFFGLIFTMRKYYSIFVAIACAVFFLIYTLLEERNLNQIYMEEYDIYKERVSMIFPWKSIKSVIKKPYKRIINKKIKQRLLCKFLKGEKKPFKTAVSLFFQEGCTSYKITLSQRH